MPQTPSNSIVQPFTTTLENACHPKEALRRLADRDHVVLLESSRPTVSARKQPLGRYTFLATDPVEWIEVPVGQPAAFERLRDVLQRYQPSQLPNDLPPFHGGLIGMLSYDLNRSLENIPPFRHDEFQLPALAMGVYSNVIAWDHQTGVTHLFANGFAGPDGIRHEALASECLSFMKQRLTESEPDNPILLKEAKNFKEAKNSKGAKNSNGDPSSTGLKLTDSFPVDGPEGLLSNFSREQYIAAVQQAKDYVHAGDVFQVNLAQRLLFPANCTSVELYQRLRACNPAPFGGYFDLGTSQVVSASPERLISLRDGKVETRPIKGTRRRTRYPEVDHLMGGELVASEKDRAENTMIVDLMRNDLSRVCDDDSVTVSQLCELEQYESVLHLVSAVEGKLRENHDVVDLLEAVFPGGSITGAPKVRAMEIISELEPTARGAYCGSLGYIGFDGNADFNILIRTITASHGWWQIPVGGGIVSQSDPVAEHDETWTKAAGMLAALRASD